MGHAPESSGHSLQPLAIISFLPDICPFKEEGRPAAGTFLEGAEGTGPAGRPSAAGPVPPRSPASCWEEAPGTSPGWHPGCVAQQRDSGQASPTRHPFLAPSWVKVTVGVGRPPLEIQEAQDVLCCGSSMDRSPSALNPPRSSQPPCSCRGAGHSRAPVSQLLGPSLGAGPHPAQPGVEPGPDRQKSLFAGTGWSQALHCLNTSVLSGRGGGWGGQRHLCGPPFDRIQSSAPPPSCPPHPHPHSLALTPVSAGHPLLTTAQT